jgi:hypothetical protein
MTSRLTNESPALPTRLVLESSAPSCIQTPTNLVTSCSIGQCHADDRGLSAAHSNLLGRKRSRFIANLHRIC